MIIDQEKEQCITYLISGYTITDTAKLLDVSRTSIYNWLADKDFKAEVDKRVRDLANAGNQKIIADVESYIDELKLLALKGKSEKTKVDALTYLLDRIYGRPSTKVDVTSTDTDKDDTDKDTLDDAIAEVMNGVWEEE